MEQRALQDVIAGEVNHCYGCGSQNNHGLQIKSYWAEDGEGTICVWRPQEYHTAAWPNVLSGGVIASLIDCHSVCTAIMDAYRAENLEWDSQPGIIYITGALQVSYLKPTPMTDLLTLHARVTEKHGRKTTVHCSLFAGDEECARGEVLAIRYAPATV